MPILVIRWTYFVLFYAYTFWLFIYKYGLLGGKTLCGLFGGRVYIYAG